MSSECHSLADSALKSYEQGEPVQCGSQLLLEERGGNVELTTDNLTLMDSLVLTTMMRQGGHDYISKGDC